MADTLGTITINKEDHDLLIAGLRRLPITGTVETLPAGMEKVLTLIEKIHKPFLEEEADGISDSSGETDKQ